MIYPLWQNSISKNDILPPRLVKKNVRDSKAWQKAMMDAFEQIGREQFFENSKYWDYYRMVNGRMSYQELREAVPQLDKTAQLLENAEIPAFLKHYDLIGGIIRDICAKFIDSQDQFHIADLGEVAENETLRYYNDRIVEVLNQGFEKEIKYRLAKRGFNPDTNQDFASEEEKQAYLQKIQEETQKATPEEKPLYDKPKFKTIGVKWAEHVMEKDEEKFDLREFKKLELKDKLLTGRWFREYKIGLDDYKCYHWDPRNTFISKEVDIKQPQKAEYIGRFHFMTPVEFIRKYHEHISSDTKKQLMGGNPDWKNYVGNSAITNAIAPETIKDWSTPQWVPFEGYHDYNFNLNLQDMTGIPMGEATWLDNETGEYRQTDRYLPRYHAKTSFSNYYRYASALREDFQHRKDLCQVTEAYFIVEEYWGILTYRSETGLLVTVDVTEDILPEFLKENNIKQNFKSIMADEFKLGRQITDEDENTIRWYTRPVTYEGVKVSCLNLPEDLYLYCKAMDYQIKGSSDFERILPVAGWVGEPFANKIMPYQASYNLCMNQIYNMLEKEIGMFFLLDVAFIPSEFNEHGTVEDAVIELRELAKDVGFLPIATSGDAQRNNTHFNQFSTQNLSYAPQIQSRITLAEYYKKQAYESIGSNPQLALQPTTYETATGVQIGNKAKYSQVSEIFQEFNMGLKGAWEVHLAVAQYAQSNKKDLSLTYTKSDGSLAFLQISDPNLPLRRFGIIPTTDSKRRAEIENYKQWLIQTNTVGADPLEVAKLLFSDSARELMEIAYRAMERRAQAEDKKHQQDMQLQDQKAQLDDQKAQREHERQLQRDEKNNEARISAAAIKAKGDSLDNYDNASQAASEIDKTEQRALEQNKLDHATSLKEMDADTKKYETDRNFELRMKELELKAQELRQKANAEENKRYIATINKN